jgi:predicted nucleic acid-binding protein
MKVLLDTTALSEPLRKQPNPNFTHKLKDIPTEALFTSAVCVMELRYGCALKNDIILWERIRRNVLNHLTILPFGPNEAAQCGEILAQLAKRGSPIGIEDTQIGATALIHGLTVVTSNIRHFERIPGLSVENWNIG